MAKSKNSNQIGSWAFLIGVILAVIFGFVTLNQTWTYVLVVLGIVVGLLNIAEDEATPFLMSGAVLVIVAALGQSATGTVAYVSDILHALLVLFVPATIVVAIKNVFNLARE